MSVDHLQEFAAGAGLLVVGGAVTWAFAARAKKVKENEDMKERVEELETQLALVAQAAIPINAAFQAMLIKQLTHYHTPVMDALMVKLGPPYRLTDDEYRELVAALEQRTKDMGDQITESEREAAAMLPLVIKRVRAELDEKLDETDPTRLQVVMLPPDPEP